MLTESEIKKTMQYYYLIHIALIVVLLTATTESRAATANMSAQETTGFPHALSTASLISSTTSNPLAD